MASFDSESLLTSYCECRQATSELCKNLSEADLQAQSMPDASPLKWHLAHTSWAFETFVLKPYDSNYQEFDKDFEYLFNSYYNAIGMQYPRDKRGLLTRPSIEKVNAYRQHVDTAMQAFLSELATFSPEKISDIHSRVALMINHEQQHQELMLTDFKHLLSFNPTFPVYGDKEKLLACSKRHSIKFEAGLYSIGADPQANAFYFDNEAPLHQFYAQAFSLESSLVSNAEYLEFVKQGGYENPAYWLSEAWQLINKENKRQPLYWHKTEQGWCEYTLNGLKKLELQMPVKHLNYFEANAFANFKGKRLPSEQEWEIAATSGHPDVKQMFNQLWQWTSSNYGAYPGFKPVSGAVGEYNGKFMVNQYVLRGGSIATPKNHIRPSYRNFFYPGASWQFSGTRLAETL